MSKWLGIVCIAACFGMGCGDDDTTGTDSGPVGMDAGPGEMDTGPGETDAGPVSCEYDGTYGVEFVDGPDLCTMVDIQSCSLLTTDGVPTVTCTYNEGEEASGECTYDDACVCTGMATIDSIAGPVEATISGDFPNGTLSAVALGQTCNFMLVSM